MYARGVSAPGGRSALYSLAQPQQRYCARAGARRASATRANKVVATRAVAEEAAVEAPAPPPAVKFRLSCPICQETAFDLMAMPNRKQGLSCPRCSRTFSADASYVDLTLTSGFTPKAYSQRSWTGTELFRNPLVSFVYERGWRQGFAWAGFPGVEKEFEMAMDYLRPAYGDVLVDMSCGSGLFTRRFVRSGKFAGVIAADYSESMLQQTKAFLEEKPAAAAAAPSLAGSPMGSGEGSGNAPVVLLRADVGRLPFPTGSVSAIHAGAAIHCWPNPQAALAEISRVLKPGGVLVGSTFMVATAPLGELLPGSEDLLRPLNQLDQSAVRNNYKWWEEAELRDLCASVGLQSFSRSRQFRFIMFSATKPAISSEQDLQQD